VQPVGVAGYNCSLLGKPATRPWGVPEQLPCPAGEGEERRAKTAYDIRHTTWCDVMMWCMCMCMAMTDKRQTKKLHG
jgi:hypothetical protein